MRKTWASLAGALLFGLSSALAQPGPSPGGGGGGGTGYGTPVLVTAAGTNQGTATLLTSALSVVNSAAAGTGVILSLSYTSVQNQSANVLNVYPPSSGSITYDGASLGTNTAMQLAVGATATFFCPSSTACFAAAVSFQ